MAVLDNIRKRTGLMLIVVLGATAAFVLGDLLSGPSGGSQQNIGEINGEDVDAQSYNRLVDKYVSAQNQNGQRGSRTSAENYAWNDMVFNYGWKSQIEKSGIAVTRLSEEDDNNEEFDMMQGKTLLKDFFGQNQKNLPFNEFVEEFNGIISGIMDAGEEHPSYSMLVGNRENYYNSRLRDKYTTLFSNSVYVTTAEARRKTQGEGATAAKTSFEYVYAPFGSLQDSTVSTTDEELKAYISKHQNSFDVKEGRDIKYVALSYRASSEDKQQLLTKANSLKSELATTTDDQEFVNLNSDTQTQVGLALYSTLPSQVKADSASLAEGKIYGPFFTNNKFETYKISAIRLGAGVSKTSVSVISIDTSRIADDKVAAALDSAATILATATTDSASAASLAWTTLGEIETTDTIKYNQAILDASFAVNEAGVFTSLVAFPQGVLILRRDEKVEQADNKYAIAKVDLELTPSQITRDSVWDVASQLIGNATSLTVLEDSLKNRNDVRLESVMNADKNAQRLGRYSGNDVASIISWSYQNKVGSISTDIYELPEQEVYLIAAVAGESEKDKATVDAVRPEVTTLVLNEKKAAQLVTIFNKYKGKTLVEISIEINKEQTPNFSSYNSVNDLTIGSTYIPNFNYGYDAILAGTAFGLTKDATSNVLIGEKGVFIIKVKANTEPTTKKEYSNEKKTIIASAKYAQVGKLNSALDELIEIEDTRYLRR
jgi:peptidyl-prolyl cis-trans isomerase D